MRKLIKAIIGILTAVVICIVLGWGVYGLGKLYLGVIGTHTVLPQISAEENSAEKQVMHLPGFEVFFLQLGIFQDRSNAENFARGLAQQGIRAVVLNEQPYRVVTGFFSGWPAAREARAELKGVKPVEKSLEVKGLNYKVAAGNGEQVKTVLINYGELLGASAKAFDSAVPGNLKSDTLAGLAVQMKQLRSDTEGAVKILQASPNLAGAREALLALDRQGEQAVRDVENMAGSRSKENYLKAQNSLMQLFSLYRGYLTILQKKTTD